MISQNPIKFLLLIFFFSLTVTRVKSQLSVRNSNEEISSTFQNDLAALISNPIDQDSLYLFALKHPILFDEKSRFINSLEYKSNEADMANYKAYTDSLFENRNKFFYPLIGKLDYEYYNSIINSLLNSNNTYKNILAYQLIGAINDTSKRDFLFKKLTNTDYSMVSNILVNNLVFLKSTNTTILFKHIAHKRGLHGSDAVKELFFETNKDSLIKTAYFYMDSKDENEFQLANQLLTSLPLTETTAFILRSKLSTTSDLGRVNQLLNTIQQLSIGNLKERVIPYLSTSLKYTVCRALGKSPSASDQQLLLSVLDQYASATDIEPEMMQSLASSNQISIIQRWFDLLKNYNKYIPFNYYENEFLSTETVLPYLQNLLPQIKSDRILNQLIPCLTYRNDHSSIKLLLTFLKNKKTQHTAANALYFSKSELIRTELLPILIDTPNHCDKLALLATKYPSDSLHSYFKAIAKNYQPKPYERNERHLASLLYLMNHPKSSDEMLFKEIILNPLSNERAKCYASAGLRNFKTQSTIYFLKALIPPYEEEDELSEVEQCFNVTLKELQNNKGNTK